MRLLIDTNVILEVMLGQAQAQAAQAFLALAGQHEFHLSNFALDSLCQILLRRQLAGPLESFLKTGIYSGNITVLPILPTELTEVINTARLLRLDFDDAYQYTLAEKHNLTLVSFDKDFDKTPRGRQTPKGSCNLLLTPTLLLKNCNETNCCVTAGLFPHFAVEPESGICRHASRA